MAEKNPYQKYDFFLRQSGIRLPPLAYLAMVLLIAVIVGAVFFFGFGSLLGAFKGSIKAIAASAQLIFSALAFLVVFSMLAARPWMQGTKRIEDIEISLADALKQMADTLKSGGTYEYALREIASAEYGALTEEMSRVLRKLEEGENFENSMKSLSDAVD